MATTIYTNWSTSYTPSGASYARKYRGWLTYNITTTDDKVTVTAYSGIEQNLAMSTNYTDTQSATGQTSVTGTASFDYSTGELKKTLVPTKTYTWARTQVAQTKTISIAVHTTSGYSAWQTTTLSKSVSISVPAKPSYVVSYDVNGGNGTIPNGTKWYNENLPLSDGNGFSKAGYTLTKWNTNSAGTGTPYDKGASYTSNAALALYAIWTPNTYTVQFNSNDGTSRTSTQAYTYDEAKTLTSIATIGWTRTNYMFMGWTTSADSNVVIYKNGASVLNLTTGGTVKLYAVWQNIYEKPNITQVLAYRGTITTNSTIQYDETGMEGYVQAHITPGIKYTLNNNNELIWSYVKTQITVTYEKVTTNNPSSGSLGTVTIEGADLTDDTTWLKAWSTINSQQRNLFDLASQYTITITAKIFETIDNLDSSKLVKSEATTFISIAEFTVDFDPSGESIGIFGIANGKINNLTEKAIWLNSELILSIDTNDSSTIDGQIGNILQTLQWDSDVDVTNI